MVELLVVIAILGILISLVTAGAQMARRKAAVTAAKSMVASLETDIAMYESDLGEYPSKGNANLVKALTEEPENNVHWAGPYHEFKEAELKGGELVDSWGEPYQYVSVNGGALKHREHSFDLYSLGLNGTEEDAAGDDIFNW